MSMLYHQAAANPALATIAAVGFCIVALITWSIGTAIYNLFLHPLAKFPGPRSAAISRRWLRDVSLTGKQADIFERLHHLYGSRALRIAPNELHISDSSLYKTIYGQDGPYLKGHHFYEVFPGKDNIFTTTNPVIHKHRRTMMNHCFSRNAVMKKQDILLGVLERMRLRLEKHGHDRLVNLNNLCRLYPSDVVVEFLFGIPYDSMTNSDDDFKSSLLQTFDIATRTLWPRMFSPITRFIEGFIPLSVMAWAISDVKMLKGWLDYVMNLVIQHQSREVEKGEVDDDRLLDSIKDLSIEQQSSEAVTIIAAGSDTTGIVLSYACWQLVRNDSLRARLLRELDDLYASAAPNPPDIPTLESGSILGAIAKESLRCGIVVPGRLPRVVPAHAKTPLTVDGVEIPPGTTVGISTSTVHFDEELWGPDARQFRPDRWLEPDSMAKASNLVAFSRGARNCIGQNLAMNELHTFLAFVFHTYSVKLMAGPEELHLYDNFSARVLDPYYVTLTPRVPGEH